MRKIITVAKVRRICDVRGCNNIGAYNITRTRNSGNSVIMCRECLEDALRVVKTRFEAPKEVPKEQPIKAEEVPKEAPKPAKKKSTKKGDV